MITITHLAKQEVPWTTKTNKNSHKIKVFSVQIDKRYLKDFIIFLFCIVISEIVSNALSQK